MTNWLVGAYGPDMDGTAVGVTKLSSRDDGSLEPVAGFLIEAPSPAFLARGNGTVYAALEGEAAVLDLTTGERMPSGGTWPSSIGVYDGTVVTTNYFDGSISATRNGVMHLLPAIPGSGPHPVQDGPRAHATAQVAPGVILSADLGTDRVGVHSLVDGVLELTDSVTLRPGTGPRDILVDGENVYVLGEHGHSITVLAWAAGALTIVDEVPLPGAQEGDTAAALALSNGFLYTGLRGSHQIAVLSVAGNGSAVEGVTSVSSEGAWPRHLVVEGDLMHVANERSNGVASFRIGADGIPKLIAEPTWVASPTYLLAD